MQEMNVRKRSAGNANEKWRNAGNAGNEKWRIAVTGAAGFLGGKIVELLLEKCDEDVSEIRGFDIVPVRDVRIFNESARSNPGLRKTEGIKLNYVQCDIRNHEKVVDALQGIDLVFHCASYININTTEEDNDRMYDVNVNGTENVIRACKENKVPYLVYTSSLEVVFKKNRLSSLEGDESLPTYNSPSDYNLFYAYTKSAAERMVLGVNGQGIGRETRSSQKITTCSLRPTMIYGEHNTSYGVITALRIAKTYGVFPRIGWRPKPYQTVYVGNLAWAHIMVLKTARSNPGRISGKAYFVTDDTPVTDIWTFTEPFLKAVGCKYSKFAIPFFLVYLILFFFELIAFMLKPFCSIDLPVPHKSNIIANCHFGHKFSGDRLKEDTGYMPCYTPEESQKRTIQYFVDVQEDI